MLARASAAKIASDDALVEKVCIWTPDKDLAQCVRGDRVVQIDRKSKQIRDADGVRLKFGVEPSLIPDFLALVGDSADGYPGISGIGAVSAARLLNRHGAIEEFPPAVLGERLGQALLFKDLATLRTDAALFANTDELEWKGATTEFQSWTERMQAPGLFDRCNKAQEARATLVANLPPRNRPSK